MNRTRPTALLLILLLAFATSACMRPQASPSELLNRALNAFHGHLIFQRFDEAAAFVPTATRKDFMTYYEDQGEDLKITEYELTRLEMNPEETIANAEVTISWYRLPSSTIQKTKMQEEWNFDKLTSRWEVIEQKEKGASSGAAEPTEDVKPE
ncbi:MAG: hypothetical protein CO108_12350 [Deltaproteobacteria bacterium CG_4_9_14_3_um_filter_63_12]|nr:MAG: hypothetical protein CO108_12350 [Deltaproteobacteria bacterium CG_4_9_14_3_um_filter_63_12]